MITICAIGVEIYITRQNVLSHAMFFLITVHNSGCGKVMFSQACIIPSVYGGGEACVAKGGMCGKGGAHGKMGGGGMCGEGGVWRSVKSVKHRANIFLFL